MIDQSTINGTTNIAKNALPVVVNFLSHEEISELTEKGWVPQTFSYKFRYTVHRQYVGFFTPMVFDVVLETYVRPTYERANQRMVEEIVEPFVEGALFVNHTSSILVEFLKGQSLGYNRAAQIDRIRKSVTTPFEEFTDVWYSDWETPPITLQSQRIFVYDMDNPHHGSMLDPINVCNFINRFLTWTNTGQNVETFVDLSKLSMITIESGYTEKVTVHARD